ncbi:MAG TPA: hypothetical protein VFQ35_24540, partial [Polyangiaceae bacterium]|nr:hypothetical protein [Polyangiaceae bacterium]
MNERSALRRIASRTVLAWLASAALVIAAGPASADVIRLDSDTASPSFDPAADFDTQCLGPTPEADCDARAALIEAELFQLLAQLENDEAPKTLAIFQGAIDLDSPLIQAIAMRYLARAEQQPTDFMSKVKMFLLGPDAPLGVSAAEVLRDSALEPDQKLSELYRQQRTAADYALASTPAADADPASEDLVQACTKDARLEQMPSFAADEQFSPAARLLMYDRFLPATFEVGKDYPVTSFVTDASVAEVSAFFTKRFGQSYGPYADAQTRYQSLSLELVSLQAAAQKGDQAAIARIQQIGEELVSLQPIITLGGFLQLPAIHAENDLVWVDGNPDDLTTSPSRVVTVGADALLEKTVIRYINAPKSGGSGGAGGAGGSNGAGGRASGGRASGGAGGLAGAAGENSGKSDSGCGCAIPGAPRGRTGLLALLMAAVFG